MSDPSDPSVLRRLDKEMERAGGVNAGKLTSMRPVGYRRWPLWQKLLVIVLIVAVFALYVFLTN